MKETGGNQSWPLVFIKEDILEKEGDLSSQKPEVPSSGCNVLVLQEKERGDLKKKSLSTFQITFFES